MKSPEPKKSITSRLKLGMLASLLFIIVGSASAQNGTRETVNQSIGWLSLNSNMKLHSKFGISLDVQIRQAGTDAMQRQVTAGFDYFVTKSLTIIPLGLSHVWNYQYGKQPAAFVNDENRIFQSIAYKHKISRIAVSHRFKVEERFLQVHTKGASDEVIDNGYTNKQVRFRYRAMFNIPINHDKMGPKTVYLSIWDEIFMSRGKSVTFNAPDQNRIFVGLGYQVTKDFSFQGGYFLQTLIKSNGTKQENNAGIYLQMNYNFDFSKK
ncbi:MAG: DUF2490 domain-containing protein [Chryseolinea sp.]